MEQLLHVHNTLYIKNHCILTTLNICMLRMFLTISRQYFAEHHSVVGLCNENVVFSDE